MSYFTFFAKQIEAKFREKEMRKRSEMVAKNAKFSRNDFSFSLETLVETHTFAFTNCTHCIKLTKVCEVSVTLASSYLDVYYVICSQVLSESCIKNALSVMQGKLIFQTENTFMEKISTEK